MRPPQSRSFSAIQPSGYKGVFRKGGRFYTQIMRPRQFKYLGTFDTAVAAAVQHVERAIFLVV